QREAALDLLKTQIENEPKSSQSNRQKPEITRQAYQSRVLRSLQVIKSVLAIALVGAGVFQIWNSYLKEIL
ncbi:hypothetical protein, partial [Acetobacter fabarum]|uniref:hypothetical protein n=1 Tax=Acetobacter fabarum TaxID=483199 RepID=UPI000BEF8EA2